MKVFSEIPIRAIIAGQFFDLWLHVVATPTAWFSQACGDATLRNGVSACFGLFFCDAAADFHIFSVFFPCIFFPARWPMAIDGLHVPMTEAHGDHCRGLTCAGSFRLSSCSLTAVGAEKFVWG